MRITEEAKKFIKSNYNEEINGIIININKSCCSIGEDIRIAFDRVDKDYFIVDDIRVFCDSYTKKQIDNLVIDYKNNMIVFGDENDE